MPRLLPQRARVLTRLALLAWLACVPGAWAQSANPAVPDAGGYPAPTAALERGRATYVLSHCHFCHGTDLRRAVMGASDLLRNALVGADTDGDLIGPVVQAGRPNLQTAMPRYDFTATEVTELARYIHYLRQTGRFADLTAAALAPGDAAAGEAFFGQRCASCHTPDRVRAVVPATDAAGLRARLLRPKAFAAPEAPAAPGRREHLTLLEQFSETDLANLLAYLHPDRARR